MKTLYVSDMDGTLLDNDSVVSPNSTHILNKLARRGVMFTVATARTPATVDPLLKGIFPVVPAVVMTGAALWDRAKKRYINPRFIPRDDLLPILEECRRHDIAPFVYIMGDDNILDVYCTRNLDRGQRQFVDQRSNLPLKRFHIGEEPPLDTHGDRAMLVYGMGPIDSVYHLADIIRTNSECALSAYADIFDHRRGNLEIFAPGVSKAAGIKSLAQMVDADSITVFGDNLNDLSMMEIADRAVAVGNALDAVKASADLTIGPNVTDSVARFIEEDIR